MKKIGITGQNGFIGKHLYNTLALQPDKYEIIPFQRHFFQNEQMLDSFVNQCDIIVHLAAINRHESTQYIYDKNIELSEKLVSSLRRTSAKPHVIFSSSSQEEKNNTYGRSKLKARKLLEEWATEVGAFFTGLIIPNVFGPFGEPNYNSFIATFCYKIANNEQPEVQTDSEVNLIYIDELISEIISKIESPSFDELYIVPHTSVKKVTDVLGLLKVFQDKYIVRGQIPHLRDRFELNLFNMFCTYVNHESYYPVKLNQNIDKRGSFVEIMRFDIGGQSSFSTTVPNITRGNHFHTRKIERFAVIKGKARIQLRKIDSDKVMNFYLDGSEPSYVDMPIWYTHNITNIGDEELYTIFWINEPYDPEDPDTYFLEV